MSPTELVALRAREEMRMVRLRLYRANQVQSLARDWKPGVRELRDMSPAQVRSSIVNRLRDGQPPLTRQNLIHVLGTSRSAVSDAIGELLRDGVITGERGSDGDMRFRYTEKASE